MSSRVTIWLPSKIRQPIHLIREQKINERKILLTAETACDR
jgi:hypothetical protein